MQTNLSNPNEDIEACFAFSLREEKAKLYFRKI